MRLVFLETLAVLAGLRTFHAHTQNTNLIIHVDNAAAVHALYKGVIGRESSQPLIAAVHNFLFQRNIKAFFAYINTKRNVADIPSRVQSLQKVADHLGASLAQSGLTIEELFREFANRKACTEPAAKRLKLGGA